MQPTTVCTAYYSTLYYTSYPAYNVGNNLFRERVQVWLQPSPLTAFLNVLGNAYSDLD